ncbi:hypothetical protein D3C85_1857450 [compost metagenome]
MHPIDCPGQRKQDLETKMLIFRSHFKPTRLSAKCPKHGFTSDPRFAKENFNLERQIG